MARKHKDDQPSNAVRATLQETASAAETAEYVAQMCAELGTLAQSSAEYIAAMTCELSMLASSAKLDRLSSLLDDVRKEAESAT